LKQYLEKKYFDNSPSLKSSVIGIIFIIAGIIVLFKPTPMNLKIGISSILIGLFLIGMMTGKNTTKRITDAQITLPIVCSSLKHGIIARVLLFVFSFKFFLPQYN